MKSINGVDLAKRIRKDNETVQIIFITGFPDFMAEGYEVSALNYLMKPVREEKLFEVLDKARKSLHRKQRSILITSDGEVHRISIGQIMLCESFAHRTVITTKTKIYDVKLPISELESQLDDTFIRCHRSYIAAINHISRISKTDVLLDNGKKIPLSRRLYDEVNQAFIKYFKGDNHGTT
jgi:DNA-binding LytR/AlgR family response regulator